MDTRMDTTLTVTPVSFQNAVTVTSQAANATDSHFITMQSYEELSPNLSRKLRTLEMKEIVAQLPLIGAIGLAAALAAWDIRLA